MTNRRRDGSMYAAAWRGASDSSLEHRVGSNVKVDPDTGCWDYQLGGTQPYPLIGPRGAQVKAYHYVYQTLVGPIPEGHHLHHECGNKRCVNPEHLMPLTPGEHMRRHAEKRRG